VREPEPGTIGRARAGDLRAFESLVRDYQADVWRFAYHLTRNRAAADDVTQEAFLRAFRAIGQYRGQAKFTSWLLRITRNCAIDTFRRTGRERPTDTTPESEAGGAWIGSEGVAASASTSAADDRLRIQAAVRGLPLELREPFVVIEVLGFNYQEASAILGVKLGTLKSRMHRARASLMEALGETGAEAADEM
jgi:RNA polymerase sigma-70 factor, ECF subfamily